MKQSSKKIGGYAIIGLLVIGAILILPNTNFNINILAVGTATTNNLILGSSTGKTFSGGSDLRYTHDIIRGKNIFKGVGEIADDKYVASWYTNGNSEKILLTGHSSVWNGEHCGWAWSDSPRRDILVGRYWWKGYYYPANVDPATGTGTLIFDKNFVNSQYVKLATDSVGTFNKQPFANGDYQTKSQLKLTYDVTGYDSETTWWVPFDPECAKLTQWYNNMETRTTAFQVVGTRPGFIKVQLYVEYAELYVWGGLSEAFGYLKNNALVQQDILILEPGVGDVDATSKNSLSGVPGYTAEGSADSYTRYVYKEGQTVTFHYKVGASGPTSSGTGDDSLRWKFEIYKPGSSTAVYSKTDITDNSEGDITYIIPAKSFVSGGDNGWSYKLTNGLLVQSEGKIFVVDALEKIPGRTTITTDKTEYLIGDKVTVTCKANCNPTTLVAITKFDVWAKYGSSTGTSYAYGPAYVTDLQISGNEYSGRFSFTPTKTGSIYIRGHAIDKDGYAGAENADKLIVIKDIPHFQLTVYVKDSQGTAIQNADVTFHNVHSTTDVSGKAVLSVESATDSLYVSKTGYTAKSQDLSITAARTVYVVLQGGATAQDVTITVYDSADATTIDGASITLDTVTRSTGSNGQAIFSQIASGNHSLAVTKDGYSTFSETLKVPEDLVEGIYAVQLYSGTPDEPDEPDEPGGETYQVIIDIIDSDTSEYIEGATVQIGSTTKTTDAMGSAEFELAADSYTATVTKSGYETKTDTVSVTDTTYRQIYIVSTGGGDDGGDDGGSGGTYAVTVNVFSSGSSIAGALVQVGNTQSITGPEGTVIIQNIPSGDTYLTVYKSDYDYYTQTITVTSDTSFEVPLTQSIGPDPSPGEKCTITVTVKNSKDKSLLSGVTVNIGGVSKTTENGVTTIEVSQGAQTIMVAKSGFNPFSRSITVSKNMAFTVDLVPSGDGGSIPGFELISLVIAVGVSMILLKVRRKKK